ncbi:MAG TPA: GntR family transcriptional regulator, partial [bacterium]|nr:GntR family transcriptional regulator [bacterium]
MDALYQKVATEIAERIDSGVYIAGERLPGVRSLAHTRGVSVATAVAAYQMLADSGRVEARPRSGFYVRPRRVI